MDRQDWDDHDHRERLPFTSYAQSTTKEKVKPFKVRRDRSITDDSSDSSVGEQAVKLPLKK